MKLTDVDVQLFAILHDSVQGRDLLDYLDRLKMVLFDPETLTADNLTAKQEAWRLIEDHLIHKIQLTEPPSRSKTESFE